jgi:hypothetical protein
MSGKSRRPREPEEIYYADLRAALGQSMCFSAFTQLDARDNLIVHRNMGDPSQYMVYVIRDHSKIVGQPLLIQEEAINIVSVLYNELLKFQIENDALIWLPLELLQDALYRKFMPDGRLYSFG